MTIPDLTVEQLLDGARELTARFPGASLVKNPAGNLAILVDDVHAGFLDLRTGRVTVDDDMLDRELVSRVRGFLGHVEDMPDNERVFLLGALCGALERRLGSEG